MKFALGIAVGTAGTLAVVAWWADHVGKEISANPTPWERPIVEQSTVR